ncbi:3-phosphoshikimate 1-carboxyvinyltransferase [Eubacteriaceae bacterium ES3]|nr:3-phosphoshikimate 1-carboxyvinyltransferase [Eubacteriaceae bacterium ES3]
MKILKIEPHKLTGVIQIPPSKSVSHRAIISAALAKGRSTITNVLMSQDMIATCKIMENFGASIAYKEEEDHRFTLIVDGNPDVLLKHKELECNESGSTLRFIIPIVLLQEEEAFITGKGRLTERPMEPYYKIFDEKEIVWSRLEEGSELPLSVKGKLKPGVYSLDGGVSSQFITGLMFALPLLPGNSRIHLTSSLESKPYIDITLEILQKFGIEIINDRYRNFLIKGNQKYQARDFRVEGDFSQGAFWMVAGSIGNEIRCRDLNLNSAQGDKVIAEIIKKMGGQIDILEEGLLVEPAKTKGIVIDVSQCPDLVPILAVLASFSKGQTRIINGERLRFKESDRLMATADFLNKLGGKVKETEDGLIIENVENLTGNTVSSHNDHRIAMAVAIASMMSESAITLSGADAVNKSYPHFWDDFKFLGGEIHELDLGE